MSAAVVRLPTAAPRKVRQCWSRTTKADREALLRLPVIHRTPEEREAERSAAIIGELEMTPELAMAFAMFQVMQPIDQIRAQGFLALMADSAGVRAAIEYCHFATALPRHQRMINEALGRLRGEP